VKEAIDSDLVNLKWFFFYTKIAPKNLYLDQIIEYTRKELFEECDYQMEAKK
jgi:predicted unusual protein kinase regulating ubiquinone biosynthesis (AarF/ABC1/UbiB family)